MGGSERHLTNFLPELDRIADRFQITLQVRESFAVPHCDNIRVQRVPDVTAGQALRRLLYDVMHIPRILRDERYDVVVSLTNFGPIWSPIPHILFQRNPIYYCPLYQSKVRGLERAEVMMRRKLAIETMKRAAIVVTPSNAMSEMIKRACGGVDGTRFETLYHGFSADTLSAEGDREIARYLALPGIKLLYPTHAALHKGFDVLVAIMAELVKARRMDLRLLTTVSDEDWPRGVASLRESIAFHGLQDRFLLIGRVPQRQMGMLYRGCRLMIYPSLCESFGFSMIEAMGSGLPIVAADTAVNREMCGDAALFYPPLDPMLGAEAVAIALESRTHAELKARAQGRLSEFDWSWSRYAREFVTLLRTVQ